MKLALCLFNYFPYGGLQRDFLRIARACRDRGHEIHIFTMAWQGENERGMQVHLLKPAGLQNYTRIRSYIKQLQAALREDHYDLVVGFNKMPGLDIYYAADVCYQSRMQERSWIHRLLPRYRFYVAMEQAVFSPAAQTEILLISPLQQSEFVRYYQTEASRFHLLPPGITRDRVAPHDADAIRTAFRAAQGIISTDNLLLMVGSGFKTKGVDRSITALAALPPALRDKTQLFILGQDNPSSFIRLAKSLKVSDRVKFLGGRPDVPDFLLAADVLLHPAYHENTGTVLLEALAAGLPVLTVDKCGYAHYVQEANAGRVLTSPFKQKALNEALADMLSSSARADWRACAIVFSKQADIYSLPEKAADFIEAAAKDRAEVFFDRMMKIKGEIFRSQKGRVTQRVILDGKAFFLKRQASLGYREIFKNLLQLRRPVTSVRNEWEAIEKLSQAGIAVPKVFAKGERGRHPAKKESFVLLEEIAPAESLETVCARWKTNPPEFRFKQILISAVAGISRKMHALGINHRDFYLCHFLLKMQNGQMDLYLIDLHRAQIRNRVPPRWQVKDLAGLYFSSYDAGLTRHDQFRFIQWYHGKPLRDLTTSEWQLWQKAKERGEQLYRDHQG